MTPPFSPRMIYDAWRSLFDLESGTSVLDDEGRRRCADSGDLDRILTRGEAEAYNRWNSFVRRRAGDPFQT
ncbi:MAG: hypothetical protein VX916_02760 [Planctomycetota bacterium]|nr:hypothetical protein [Planctomycetota bacterium]